MCTNVLVWAAVPIILLLRVSFLWTPDEMTKAVPSFYFVRSCSGHSLSNGFLDIYSTHFCASLYNRPLDRSMLENLHSDIEILTIFITLSARAAYLIAPICVYIEIRIDREMTWTSSHISMPFSIIFRKRKRRAPLSLQTQHWTKPVRTINRHQVEMIIGNTASDCMASA